MNAQQLAEALYPVDTAYVGVACANCMTSSPNLVACAACKHARYCNKQCQIANWKEHKPVCQILKSFRSMAVEQDGEQRGGLRLQRQLKRLELLWERLDDHDPMRKSLQLPCHDPAALQTTWTLAAKFLRGCRCCSICNKTEYDVPMGESKEWKCCSFCQFGWCCSEEHWSEYKSRHTKSVCNSYRQSVSVCLFMYKHVKNNGETFLHLPRDVRSTPLKKFPSSWKEYFEIRNGQEYAMRGMLPQEFFPAATLQLSQATNCLYGMYQLDKQFFTTTKILTLHVVGAAPVYELSGGGATCVLEELMHCLPAVERMNVVFVGPEACASVLGQPDKCKLGNMACCPDCTSKGRSRSVTLYGKTYHEFAQDDVFTKPDFVVAFNTGMFEEYTESWKTSLKVILDMDVASLFTSYNKMEADGDLAVLQELGAQTLTASPVLNPFSVDYETIDPSGVDEFFKINMYCICFRGRK